MTTLLTYAIENAQSLELTIQQFVDKGLPFTVGAVDLEQDTTYLHWVLRQGLNPRSRYATDISRKWPLAIRPPDMQRWVQDWGKYPRQDIEMEETGRHWWDDPMALATIHLRQEAIVTGLATCEAVENTLLDLMIEWQKKLRDVQEKYGYLRTLQQRLDEFLKDVEDVKSLTRRTLQASNLDELRAMCFPPDYIESVVQERVKERLRNLPKPPRIKRGKTGLRRGRPHCIYCDKEMRDLERALDHQARCEMRDTRPCPPSAA